MTMWQSGKQAVWDCMKDRHICVSHAVESSRADLPGCTYCPGRKAAMRVIQLILGGPGRTNLGTLCRWHVCPLVSRLPTNPPHMKQAAPRSAALHPPRSTCRPCACTGFAVGVRRFRGTVPRTAGTAGMRPCSPQQLLTYDHLGRTTSAVSGSK